MRPAAEGVLARVRADDRGIREQELVALGGASSVPWTFLPDSGTIVLGSTFVDIYYCVRYGFVVLAGALVRGYFDSSAFAYEHTGGTPDPDLDADGNLFLGRLPSSVVVAGRRPFTAYRPAGRFFPDGVTEVDWTEKLVSCFAQPDGSIWLAAADIAPGFLAPEWFLDAHPAVGANGGGGRLYPTLSSFAL